MHAHRARRAAIDGGVSFDRQREVRALRPRPRGPPAAVGFDDELRRERYFRAFYFAAAGVARAAPFLRGGGGAARLVVGALVL